MRTSPGPATGSGSSTTRRTSGPPNSTTPTARRRLPQLLVEEGDDLRPQLLLQTLVQRTERVVRSHEGVARAGMDCEAHVLAHALELGLERIGGRRPEEVVVLGHVTAHDRCQSRPVRFTVTLREPIERDNGLDPVASMGREDERKHATHAEPDRPQCIACDRTVT